MQVAKSERDTLSSAVEYDYGTEYEFMYMKGQCYSIDSKEYTYEMCPYGKSQQKDKRHYGDTSLGTWTKWDPKYSSFKFENGQSCWQGPNRSNTITFICGAETKVKRVDEPSRCVYAMEVEAPSACTDADLQAVEAKLQALE